jgi:c-di-GMP-binding flagellar brake protein YcgR
LEMQFTERREHARLHITVPLQAVTAKKLVHGELRDISMGGAAATFPAPIGNPGETIKLIFPDPQGAGQSVEAEIVRCVEREGGELVGFRFRNINRELRDSLLKLCDHLIDAKGGGIRKFTRVARRIPMAYGSQAEFAAIVENISLGGMAMTVESPLDAGDTVEIFVRHPTTQKELIFRPVVVYQNPIGGDTYRIGLEFKDMGPGEKKRLKQLLRAILRLKREKKP